MNKFRNIVISFGNGVAALLMFAPIFIITSAEKLGTTYTIILLILSICYDTYIYSIIKQNKYLEETKKLFLDVFNGKTVESKTEEQKLNWYKVICINLFMDYFNKDKWERIWVND